MILMGVSSIVGENKMRVVAFELFEHRLNLCADKRHKSVTEAFNDQVSNATRNEQRCRQPSFFLPNFTSTEYDPIENTGRILLSELKNCAAAPDFNVIRMA